MTPYNQQFQAYAPMLQPNSRQQATPTVYDTGILWVQGESGAKAYPVAPGKSTVLFDSETERFFIKTVDVSGMPQPLRVFSYSESPENLQHQSESIRGVFVTREEFEHKIGEMQQNFRDYIDSDKQKGADKNGKPSLQSTK